jgi:cysteine desulfuration protein SufE
MGPFSPTAWARNSKESSSPVAKQWERWGPLSEAKWEERACAVSQGLSCSQPLYIHHKNHHITPMSKISELIADFEFLDDWEERYKYVIDLGKALPAMPDALKSPATKVNGCASQVWIHSRRADTADGPRLALVGDSDALIVKGLIAIAFMMFEPLSLDEIKSLDAQGVFAKLGLKDHLTPQRSNGLASMVQRIKQDAAHHAATDSA